MPLAITEVQILAINNGYRPLKEMSIVGPFQLCKTQNFVKLSAFTKKFTCQNPHVHQNRGLEKQPDMPYPYYLLTHALRIPTLKHKVVHKYVLFQFFPHFSHESINKTSIERPITVSSDIYSPQWTSHDTVNVTRDMLQVCAPQEMK